MRAHGTRRSESCDNTAVDVLTKSCKEVIDFLQIRQKGDIVLNVILAVDTLHWTQMADGHLGSNFQPSLKWPMDIYLKVCLQNVKLCFT